MRRGRPAKGPKLVKRLDGSSEAKRRLEIILETVTGGKTVDEACDELGIGKTAFHDLRARVLQAALQDLEPKPLGRPPRKVSEEQTRIDSLEAHVQQLDTELKIAQVREEILLAMPEVFQPASAVRKKKAPTKKKTKNRKNKRKRQKRTRHSG